MFKNCFISSHWSIIVKDASSSVVNIYSCDESMNSQSLVISIDAGLQHPQAMFRGQPGFLETTE